jgi:hypothetical protein
VADAEVISIVITVLAVLGSALFTNWQIGNLKTVVHDGLPNQEVFQSLRPVIERNHTVLLARINTINEHLTRLEE